MSQKDYVRNPSAQYYQIGVGRPALQVDDLPTPEEVIKVKRIGLEELFLLVPGAWHNSAVSRHRQRRMASGTACCSFPLPCDLKNHEAFKRILCFCGKPISLCRLFDREAIRDQLLSGHKAFLNELQYRQGRKNSSSKSLVMPTAPPKETDPSLLGALAPGKSRTQWLLKGRYMSTKRERSLLSELFEMSPNGEGWRASLLAG